MLYFLRQGQCPHEVGEIVSQGVKLEPSVIVAELAARQPRPFDGVLALLDVLLRFAPLIVGPCHPFGRTAQVGDDETDAGIQVVGILRRDLPRKTELSDYSAQDIHDLIWSINTTPLKCLGFLSSAEAFIHQLRCCT